MKSKILYEPFKTLEEQEQAEHKLKIHAEVAAAMEQEEQELLLAMIKGDVVTLPLKPTDE